MDDAEAAQTIQVVAVSTSTDSGGSFFASFPASHAQCTQAALDSRLPRLKMNVIILKSVFPDVLENCCITLSQASRGKKAHVSNLFQPMWKVPKPFNVKY